MDLPMSISNSSSLSTASHDLLSGPGRAFKCFGMFWEDLLVAQCRQCTGSTSYARVCFGQARELLHCQEVLGSQNRFPSVSPRCSPTWWQHWGLYLAGWCRSTHRFHHIGWNHKPIKVQKMSPNCCRVCCTLYSHSTVCSWLLTMWCLCKVRPCACLETMCPKSYGWLKPNLLITAGIFLSTSYCS